MKKLLCVAAVAALCVPAMGATLNLSIESGGAQAITVAPGDPVTVDIVGEVVGGPTEGLALWATNMTGDGGSYAYDLCADRFLDAPAGDMASFKRNLGLTNPGPGGAGDLTGYSGTCDGAGGLWQIGGGLNTINNTGPTLYPVADPIPTLVAEATEVTVATGTFNVPLGTEGETIELTIATPFANVILDGETGPVYAVEEADVSILAATLTINIQAAGGPPPAVAEAWSYGYHGGTVLADLGIPIFGTNGAALEEPRQIDAFSTRVYLIVEMDKAMTSAAVSTNPAIAGVSATAIGGKDVMIDFPVNPPADETCYQVDLAGSIAADLGEETVGDDFCVCYNEGNVDRLATVNAGDRNLILGIQNFGLVPSVTAADLTADLDRSGLVNAGDGNLVTSIANFGHSPTACP